MTRAFCLGALLLLCACRSVPDPGVSAPALSGREAVLAVQRNWGFSGRLAYSHAGQGGSARIDWRQTGPVSDIRLSGPLATEGVRLRVEDGQAQVFDAAGKLLAVGEAGSVFGQWLPVPLPPDDLAAGLRAYWPDSPERTAAALSGSVRSAGWDWRYQAWWPGPAVLPKQLEVQEGAVRLRVVIEHWRETGDD